MSFCFYQTKYTKLQMSLHYYLTALMAVVYTLIVVITVVLLLLLMDVLSREVCGHCLQAQRSGEDTSSVKTLFGVTFEHAVCLIMSLRFLVLNMWQ